MWRNLPDCKVIGTGNIIGRNPVRQALVFGIILFAYSTVLGWVYYGERCVKQPGSHSDEQVSVVDRKM